MLCMYIHICNYRNITIKIIYIYIHICVCVYTYIYACSDIQVKKPERIYTILLMIALKHGIFTNSTPKTQTLQSRNG